MHPTKMGSYKLISIHQQGNQQQYDTVFYTLMWGLVSTYVYPPPYQNLIIAVCCPGSYLNQYSPLVTLIHH